MSFSIIQVIDALDMGDAVSNHTISTFKLLKKMGYNSKIYSKHYHPDLMNSRIDIEKIKVQKNDILLFHFSGKSECLKHILNLKCRKVLYYHNITPHNYFESESTSFDLTIDGRNQLRENIKEFDFYVGDSTFNIQEIIDFGVEKEKCHVIPIYLDFKKYKKANKILNKENEMKFLFVGRVAPNKKHEDIMRIFEYYFTKINNNSKLILVGNYNPYPKYYNDLNNLKVKLKSSNNIIFTGKVSDEELYSYYNTADVFVCMSDHEGFCVPLLESMHFGVPTIAYDSGAIASTMGNAGVLIKEKKYGLIAELIDYILLNNEIKNNVIEGQYNWLKNFKEEKIQEDFNLLIKKVVKNNEN